MDSNQIINLNLYQERIKNGDLSWSVEGGAAVLTEKVYNEARQPVGTNKLAFTTTEISKAQNEIDRRIINVRDQILEFEQQISTLEAKKAELDLIKADVVKTEKRVATGK